MQAPQGKLIPIGGKEARGPEDEKSDVLQPVDFSENGILKELLAEMRGCNSRLVIIPTASRIPDEMGEMYLNAFGHLSCPHVEVLNVRDRRQADSKRALDLLAGADGVFFSGGDQSRLTRCFADTEFLNLLRQRYQRENFVVAGTSAGAMAMAKHMITEGESAEPVLKGLVDTDAGLGLFPEALIDTHFMNRGRLARLTEALLLHPRCVALGLSEDTGVVVSRGDHLRAIGSGVVLIIEADDIGQTNYKRAKKGEPVFIENLRMHILARGACYSVSKRRFVAEPAEVPAAG